MHSFDLQKLVAFGIVCASLALAWSITVGVIAATAP
jgi:hypothetical protein